MENELQTVLKNAPFHFDGWMLSLVRWEPCLAKNYPTEISFWVTVVDIPMHVEDEEVLKFVAEAMAKVGKLKKMDTETNSLLVSLDGLNALFFTIKIPTDNEENFFVSLQYEKLARYCTVCNRMTHAEEVCPWVMRKADHGYSRHQRQREGDNRNNQERGMSQKNPKAKRELEFEDGNQKREMGQNRERGFNGHQRRGNRSSHYDGREEASKRYKKVERNGEGARTDLDKKQTGVEKEKTMTVPRQIPTDEGSSNTRFERGEKVGPNGKENDGQYVVKSWVNGESDVLMDEREEGEMGKLERRMLVW